MRVPHFGKVINARSTAAWLGAIASAALLAAAAGSCAPRTVVTTRTLLRIPQAESTWMGRTIEDIEKVWGRSTLRESDGDGGIVVAYRHDTLFSVSASTGPNRHPTDPPTRTEQLNPKNTQTEKITKALARFWIDSNGKVYRYWFPQEIYDAGRNQPPPRATEE